MKTGDVVIFSGDDLPSTVVKVTTRSQYVHAAIVLSARHSETPDCSVIIAESHVDTSLPSLGTGERVVGVQHQWLGHRLVKSQGPVWWLPLKAPLVSEKRQQMQTWLRDLEAQQTPYDFLQVGGAGIDVGDALGFENTPDDDAFFCSELVIRALQIAGAVEAHVNSAEQVPADIIQLSCFHSPILIKTD